MSTNPIDSILDVIYAIKSINNPNFNVTNIEIKTDKNYFKITVEGGIPTPISTATPTIVSALAPVPASTPAFTTDSYKENLYNLFTKEPPTTPDEIIEFLTDIGARPISIMYAGIYFENCTTSMGNYYIHNQSAMTVAKFFSLLTGKYGCDRWAIILSEVLTSDKQYFKLTNIYTKILLFLYIGYEWDGVLPDYDSHVFDIIVNKYDFSLSQNYTLFLSVFKKHTHLVLDEKIIKILSTDLGQMEFTKFVCFDLLISKESALEYVRFMKNKELRSFLACFCSEQ